MYVNTATGAEFSCYSRCCSTYNCLFLVATLCCIWSSVNSTCYLNYNRIGTTILHNCPYKMNIVDMFDMIFCI